MLWGVPFDYEPLKENRFFAEFPSELGIEVFKIRKFKKPSMKTNVQDVGFLNTRYPIQGQYSWDEMDITLIDTIGPSTSQQVMEWVRLASESISGRQGYHQSHLKTIILKSLDPTGIATQQWRIERAMITNVDFGAHDYDSDGIMEITITIKPQKCILVY